MFLGFMAQNGAQPELQQNKNTLYESLISQMAKGESKALEQFYVQTKTAVYGFALSILTRPQDAEDVMQDTYVKIFEASVNYQPRGKPMAWILTIVRNLALMKLRDNRNSSMSGEEWLLTDGHDFTEASADRMVLNMALSKLSGEERQIIILHSVAGLKHREIASILNISLSTALSKYHRSLSKLKKQIKEEAN